MHDSHASLIQFITVAFLVLVAVVQLPLYFRKVCKRPAFAIAECEPAEKSNKTLLCRISYPYQ